MAMKIRIMIFWVMVPCSVSGGNYKSKSNVRFYTKFNNDNYKVILFILTVNLEQYSLCKLQFSKVNIIFS